MDYGSFPQGGDQPHGDWLTIVGLGVVAGSDDPQLCPNVSIADIRHQPGGSEKMNATYQTYERD